MTLPRAHGGAAMARRLVEERFSDQLSRSSLDDLKLIVSELVNNAYLHGKGQIELRLRHVHDRVRVEVMDEGEHALVKIRRPGAPACGNGLRLVDLLASNWGAVPGRTCVWAELPVGAG
jgi:anti-sigma regulatory factor (Ser/Thr protein kinase)